MKRKIQIGRFTNITIRTILTYGDRIRNTRVTKCHVLHMTAVRKFIHFDVRKKSVSEFISQGHAAMQSDA